MSTLSILRERLLKPYNLSDCWCSSLKGHDVYSLMRVHLKCDPSDDEETLDPSQLQSLPAGELPAERSGAAEGEDQPVEEAEDEGYVWETLVPEDRAHGMLLEWARALKVMQRRLSQSTLKALWSGLNKTRISRT
jgi:hypothetical protein